MCDPVSIGTAIAGIAASQIMAPKAPKMPEAPAAPAPPPASQASKMPDQQAVRAAAAGAGSGNVTAGPASTMLTGLGGVAPTGLNIGRNTLLGA